MKKSESKKEVVGPVVVGVCADPADDRELLRAAARVAVDLGLPFLEKPAKKGYEMLLVAAPGRLELRVLAGDAAIRGGRAVWVDLEEVDTESGAGRSLKQPIAKAVGLRGKKDLPMTVIDATAGWGKDTWLLAGLGCNVLAVERNRVVATLLRDGVLRAGVVRPEVLGRVKLVTADAKHLLRRIARLEQGGVTGGDVAEAAEELPGEVRGFLRPDVVYLDPMFAVGGGRKAAEKKPMRVLRRLVGDDGDAWELFEWAMRAAGKRVVVKRAAKGGIDFGVKPVAIHKGKGFCFEVYAVGKQK